MTDTPSEEAQPDIEQEIPYLLELDALRAQCQELRDGAIRALQLRNDAPRHGLQLRWSNADIDHPVAASLLRRIEQLSCKLGLTRSVPRRDQASSASSTFKYIDPKTLIEHAPPEPPEEIRVFSAAHILRANIDDHSDHLSQETLACVFHIIRELYTIASPDWALGGARAGSPLDPAGTCSAFVTHECARSLCFLAIKLEKTAAFLREHFAAVARAERLSKHSLPDNWKWRQIQPIEVAIRVGCQRASRDTIIGVPPEPELWSLNWSDIHKRIHESIAVFMSKTASALREVLRLAHEQAKPWVAGLFQLAGGPNTATNIASDFRSLGAETTAMDALSRALARMSAIPEDAQLSISFADVCDRVASALREALRPTLKFALGTVYQSVFAFDKERSISDVPDLAFAASTSGALSGKWTDAVYTKALEILAGSVDERGRTPAGHPFHYAGRAFALSPINAQVIRAIATTLAGVPGKLNPQTVARIIRFFKETGQSVEHDKGQRLWGWNHRGAGRAREEVVQPWVTAVSILALHKINDAITRKINESVKACFGIAPNRQRATDSPALESLIPLDIGLGSISSDRICVADSLEMMKAHLWDIDIGDGDGAATTYRERLFSTVLFGPPGTGKTTLASSLARSAGCDLVEVTPANILIDGTENVERRASVVMRGLSMLSDCVVLFDEFDGILQTRSRRPSAMSALEFLPAAMLPKLSHLHKAAERQRVVYLLATNYYSRLDDAAIRRGRFDFRIGIYPPDVVSRICRLHDVIEHANVASNDPSFGNRLRDVITNTRYVPANELAAAGWLRRPSNLNAAARGSAWRYLMNPNDVPTWPRRINIDAVMNELSAREGDVDNAEQEDIALLMRFESAWAGLAHLHFAQAIKRLAAMRPDGTIPDSEEEAGPPKTVVISQPPPKARRSGRGNARRAKPSPA